VTCGERLTAEPACGMLDAKQMVKSVALDQWAGCRIALTCTPFELRPPLRDRLSLEWVSAPDSHRPLRIEWFHSGATKSKELAVEYND